MRKHLYGLVAMLWLAGMGHAQSASPLVQLQGPVTRQQPIPLQIGMTLPPVWLQAADGSTAARPLLDGSKKLVLLHFWATYCGSCVKRLHWLHQWQQVAGSGLQVLAITDEPAAKALPVFQRLAQAGRGGIPLLAADSVLLQWFPHLTRSHFVWLSGEGRVLAITADDPVTLPNLQLVMQGTVPAWPVKKDQALFSRTEPLLVANDATGYSYPRSGWLSVVRYPYLPGVEVGTQRDHLPHHFRLTAVNTGILRLYGQGLGWLPMYPNGCLMPPGHRDRLWRPAHLLPEEWRPLHHVGFELQVAAPLSRDSANRLLLRQLEAHFGYRMRVDSMEVPCWTLEGQVAVPGGYLVDSLVHEMNYRSDTVLIDATAAGSRVAQAPPGLAPGSSWPAATLQAWARQQGLLLVPGRRKMRMLIIETL